MAIRSLSRVLSPTFFSNNSRYLAMVPKIQKKIPFTPPYLTPSSREFSSFSLREPLGRSESKLTRVSMKRFNPLICTSKINTFSADPKSFLEKEQSYCYGKAIAKVDSIRLLYENGQRKTDRTVQTLLEDLYTIVKIELIDDNYIIDVLIDLVEGFPEKEVAKKAFDLAGTNKDWLKILKTLIRQDKMELVEDVLNDRVFVNDSYRKIKEDISNPLLSREEKVGRTKNFLNEWSKIIEGVEWPERPDYARIEFLEKDFG